MSTTVFENSRFQRRCQQITDFLIHYVIPQHLSKICYHCYHSAWNRKCADRQLDTVTQCTVLLPTGNPQFKMAEAETPTKTSVQLDCFKQDCFRQPALLSVSMWIICTWGESDDRIPNYKRSCTRRLRGSTHQTEIRRRDCTKYN